MIIKTRHVGLIVKNIIKSKKFYGKILGLKLKKELIEEGKYFNSLIGLKKSKAKVVKIDLPDKTYIELIEFEKPKSSQKVKIEKFSKLKQMHICFTVKNINNYFKRLRKNKIKFISPPLKSDFDPVSTCFFLDPDYNYVQIVEDHS
jgi:catechol 2,3-dioxygenase-like lactoylglutathione lyase family enzyme|tara:strand:+ start:523 stop:960 length:438 start_codon:yes stop_codon:yes gene_type:complete